MAFRGCAGGAVIHSKVGSIASRSTLVASLLQESLVPVPTQLFQGSLLLGSIANAVLGESAMSNSNVLIHPVLIGGWCGLVATALNSLPVGSLDGGKMTQVVCRLLKQRHTEPGVTVIQSCCIKSSGRPG